jgi:23S rRNA (cytosine1962-C5)-methyltransferase
MRMLTPAHFTEYELIDSGQFEKLERFGKYVTIRPEPQAVWNRVLSYEEWESRADVKFVPKSSSSGIWNKYHSMPDQWKIKYQIHSGKENPFLHFRLGLTAFKHVGVFPEQAVNWEYIYSKVRSIQEPSPRILNLFAYTGGSSLAAKAAGADVTHLDSIKQVVTWARENMEISGLDNIRWIVEDAMTYVKREVRRGKKYHGIILDPPAYGHGAQGEKWKLEDMIGEMISLVTQLLDEKESFVLLNTYSLGFSSLILENLFNQSRLKGTVETGEIFLKSTTNQNLPLGVFARSI